MNVLHDFDGSRKEMIYRCRSYLDTIIMLDKLVDVEPIIGIKSGVFEAFPNIENELNEKYGDLDIRIHVHVIEDVDNSDRKRYWIPSLPNMQDKDLWRYDSKYVKHGVLVPLKHPQLPIWHIDNPDYLNRYIEWLYLIKFEGLKIYDREI